MMDPVHAYFSELQSNLTRLPTESIERVVNILHEARLHRKQVFILGNGGSASTASHFACDLGKNTRHESLANFRVVSLTDNLALITAYANDEGYENVFAQQLASFIEPNDVVIGISASGNSMNVVNTIRMAKEKGATTIGFTGFDGGKVGLLVDINLHVKSNLIEHVEDIHLMFEHVICKILRERASSSYVPQSIDRNGLEQAGIVTPEDRDLHKVTGGLNGNGSDHFQSTLSTLFSLENGYQQAGTREMLTERILKMSLESLGGASGSMMLFDESGAATEATLMHAGTPIPFSIQNLEEILNQGLAGWVMANRLPTLIPNTQTDPRWLQRPWERENGSRSAISVPLMSSDRVLGVLTLVHSQVGRFNSADLMMLAAVAMIISYQLVTSQETLSSNGDSLKHPVGNIGLGD